MSRVNRGRFRDRETTPRAIAVAAWLPKRREGRAMKGFVLTLAAGISCLVASLACAQTTPNYQGLWWNAPAASESGWGINFAHQGDVIFATWFTYDLTGK